MIACLALVDPVTPIIAQLDGPLDLLGSTAEQFEFYLCDIDSSMLAAAAPNRIKKHADKLKPKESVCALPDSPQNYPLYLQRKYPTDLYMCTDSTYMHAFTQTYINTLVCADMHT